MPESQASFGWKDAALIATILAFGGLGYLCDIHSPLALPAIPFFGLFFLCSLFALGGLCAYQVVCRPTAGLLVGLVLGVLLPALALLLLLRMGRS